MKDSKVVRQAGVTSRGRSEYVQEIVFEQLTPGSVIAFRLDLNRSITVVFKWFYIRILPRFCTGHELVIQHCAKMVYNAKSNKKNLNVFILK